jgi:uncharacterized protein
VRYPDADALVPERFDEHTIIFLVRSPDAPTFDDTELDRLQVEHLTYLRDLQRRGVLVANGPLAEQTDERLRGISIYGVPLAEALELANADPMVRAGRLIIEGARWWTAAGTAGSASRAFSPLRARPPGERNSDAAGPRSRCVTSGENHDRRQPDLGMKFDDTFTE